jgi:hypothetical protein
MKQINYIEEVLLIIGAVFLYAHNRYMGLELSFIFHYEEAFDIILALAPLFLLGLAFLIFIEKKRLLIFKDKNQK